MLEFGRKFEEIYGDAAAREYAQPLADDLNGSFNHLVEHVQMLVDKTRTYFGARKKPCRRRSKGKPR